MQKATEALVDDNPHWRGREEWLVLEEKASAE